MSSTRRFTLVEVAIAVLIFAASLTVLISVLGSSRTRILTAERRWARGHLLTSAVEFHLLAGDSQAIPEGVLPEGFSAECMIEDVADLPLEAEEEIRGWRLVDYVVTVRDPMGEAVATQRVRKTFAERW